MVTAVFMLVVGIVCLSLGVKAIVTKVEGISSPPSKPKLTKEQQQELIAAMDEWRETIVEQLTTNTQLDALTEYYNERRAMIERGTSPPNLVYPNGIYRHELQFKYRSQPERF